jgi:threonine synthase
VAQAERANPLYRSFRRNFETFEPVHARKTLASAIQIGNPVSVEKAVRTLKQFNGIVEQASEEELANAAALGDRTGMFNCPHTGVALAVLIKLLKAGKIDKSERVVVISTAHGLKFVEMKVKYHQRKLGFSCLHANQPLELPARLDAVKKALEKALRRKK